MPRRPRPSPSRPPRIGLALAGGGPLGAIYEIGALCALDEALPGLDLAALDGYVGVSAGAIVAAGLANGMSPRALCAAFIDNDPDSPDNFPPLLFYRPAWREFMRRGRSLPALGLRAAGDLLWRGRSLLDAVERLGRVLPAGVFSAVPLEERLRGMLARPGRSNDFRDLRSRLVLVATDLDSGQAAPFGMPGWDAVPISVAATASAALPGLFPPVRIGAHTYVDGALKKTLHARVLLDQGIDLLLCLNPLVPFDAHTARPHRVLSVSDERIPHIVDGGMPVVLSQTFRTLIHSRLELGMKGYEASHPNADIVLFEPDPYDPQMFFANLFSTARRRRLAEHAYQKTRADLRARRVVLAPVLARHGLALDDAVLDDNRRRLLPPATPHKPARTRPLAAPLQRLEATLDALERALPAVAPAHAPGRARAR